MSTVVRIIFRLDFETRYGIIDRPGEALKKLMTLDGPVWDGYLDSNSNRQIGVNRRVGGRYVTEYEDLVLEPRSFSGNREWKDGVPFESLQVANLLDRASLAFESMKLTFDIEKVVRIGVRLFIVGPSVDDAAIPSSTFNSKFSERFLGQSVDELKPNDAAIIIEGTIQDQVKYRIQSGPGGPLDLGRFHEHVAIEGEQISKHQFAADIDIYEQNISFKGTTVMRWYRQKLKYFEKLIAQSRAAVTP